LSFQGMTLYHDTGDQYDLFSFSTSSPNPSVSPPI
jgi:hypothetical protein